MPFVLTLREHGHSWAGRGPFTTQHATQEEAEDAVFEYVRDSWKNHFEDDLPDDPNEAVQQYFDDVLEAYDISQIAKEG